MHESLFLFFSLPSRTSAADVYELIASYYTCFYGRIAGGSAGSTCKACIVCPAGIFNFCAFSNFKILHFVTLCNFIAKMNSVPWATAHLIGVSTHLTYIRHRDIIAQQNHQLSFPPHISSCCSIYPEIYGLRIFFILIVNICPQNCHRSASCVSPFEYIDNQNKKNS